MPKKKSANNSRGFATTSIIKPKTKENESSIHNIKEQKDKKKSSTTLSSSSSSTSSPSPRVKEEKKIQPAEPSVDTLLQTLSKQEANIFQKEIRISTKKTLEDAARDQEIITKLANDELIPVLSLPYEADVRLSSIYESHGSTLKNPWDNTESRTPFQSVVYAYLMLQELQFPSEWIEKALKETSQADIDKLIYWLCLNCPPDLLPSSWSENRFYFQSIQQQAHLNAEVTGQDVTDQSRVKLRRENEDIISNTFDNKDWILSRISQDDDHVDGIDRNLDDEKTNEITEYVQKLIRSEELRRIGTEAKQRGDKEAKSKAGKELKSILSFFDANEYELRRRYPDFDIVVDQKKTSLLNEIQMKRVGTPSSESKPVCAEQERPSEEPESFFGGDLFDESLHRNDQESSEAITESISVIHLNMGNWTGQKPSNLFNAFVKRQFGGDITFYPLDSQHPLGFRAGVRIKNASKKVKLPFEKMEMTKMELVDSKYAAKDFVAVKALYHISRESHSLMRMLPPCYVTLWQEWVDKDQEERQKQEGLKTARRDMFLIQWLIDSKTKRVSNRLGNSMTGKIGQQGRERLPSSTHKSPEFSNLSRRIREQWSLRQAMPHYQSLLKIRKDLPVFKMRQDILSSLASDQIIIVCGQTGSGKSTQVPQFIVEDALENGRHDVKVICTQPRRISALSLATRVSQEMADKEVGMHDALVGYQGVILRKLEADPLLSDITHIIVDEVHERTLDSDLLLYLSRHLLMKRKDLKLVLMSATMEAASFARYFDIMGGMSVPVLEAPGRSHPVKSFFLEDIIEMTAYTLELGSEYALRPGKEPRESRIINVSGRGSKKYRLLVQWDDLSIDRSDRDAIYFPSDDSSDNENDVSELETNIDDLSDSQSQSETQYSDSTLDTLSWMSPTKVNLELIETLILHINRHPDWSKDNGSILVFLPGMAEIRRLQEQLTAIDDTLWVVPLHSTLDAADQSLVFETPPQGCRKVVLATNVAETGITIPDAVFVIDSVRAREVSYDEKRKVTRLRDVFVSKANCKQRRGRAGRVKSGFCFHLIPKSSYDKLPQQRPPEMVRLPLEEVILRCQAIQNMSCNRITHVFQGMLDPPPEKHVQQAVELLKLVTALDQNEQLTDLGKFLVGLPIDVRLGRLLLYGVFLKCLDPILTICAALSLGKSIFVRPVGQEDAAKLAHARFQSEMSDLHSFVLAFDGWVRSGANGKSAMRRYCTQNFLSWTNLWAMECIREELVQSLLDTSLLPSEFRKKWWSNRKSMTSLRILDDYNKYKSSMPVLLGILGAGLYPNILITDRNKFNSYGATNLVSPDTPSLKIAIHSSARSKSIAKGGWYTYYNARSDTRQATVKKLILMDLNRTLSTAIVLLGASQLNYNPRHRVIKVDSLEVQASPRTGALLVFFKQLLKNALHSLITANDEGEIIRDTDTFIDTIVYLIESEAQSN